MTTRHLAARMGWRVIGGLLALLLALLVGVTVVSPSRWNVAPFVNGVRGPTTGTVDPAAQTVGASDTTPTPFVNGVRGPTSSFRDYSAQSVSSSSTSPTPFVNGVRGPTVIEVTPIPTAVASEDQVVTPDVDTATSSPEVIEPSSFSVSEVTYPKAATSSSQVIPPGSFSSSPVTYPLSASSSSQVIAPSSFDSTPVTYPRSATTSSQTIPPSSFAVTPEAYEGPPSSPSSVTPTTVYVEDGPDDVDGDGCTWQEEGFGAPPPKPGSTCPSPDPCYSDSNWYDFYDVPVPAMPDAVCANGPRNQAVTMGDVLAVLFYVGTYEGDVGTPNANGVAYDSDKGVDTDADTVVDIPADGVPDGRDYDRSPGPEPNPPWEAGPPDGAVTMGDVLAVLAQVGLSCVGPP